jgi:putative heme-binding domain-containing protein
MTVMSSMLLSWAAVLFGQQPYAIYRASSPIVIDAKLDEPAWRGAPLAGDFHFPWHTAGDKEQTVVRILWDDDNLYVAYDVRDKHISAYETRRHGPVSKDDCVEIFIGPNPDKVTNYYTFEINAIGTMLNRARTDWWTGPPTWEPEGVQYRTTFHGQPKKDESPGDTHWIVELAIPLKNFAKDAAHTPPRDGDEWRLNLNRLGGRTNPQFSSWSLIPTEKPAFHTPSAFGPVRFVNREPRVRRARSAEDVAAGRTLYNRSCTMFHGLDGAAGDRAPALGAQRRYLRRRDADIFDSIKRGIPGTAMPAVPMPDADVWKMVAYIQSLRATAADDFVEGDPSAGAALFARKAGCAKCHMIRGKGGATGPDLSDIAASRTTTSLRDALTKLPAHATRGFQPVKITTTDGRTIHGMLRNEHNFSYQVLDSTGKLHLLESAEVRDLRYVQGSVMPRDFDKRLTKEEFQNLLAFLARQARSRETADEEDAH